jgi:hypothetical protein
MECSRKVNTVAELQVYILLQKAYTGPCAKYVVPATVGDSASHSF